MALRKCRASGVTSDKTVSDKPVNGVRRSVEYISHRPEIAAMARNLPGLIEAYKEAAANGNSGHLTRRTSDQVT